MKNEQLPSQAPFEIASMEKLAGQRTARVACTRGDDGVAAAAHAGMAWPLITRARMVYVPFG